MKSIFIVAFNRKRIFFRILTKLKNCKNYNQYKKVIVYQNLDERILRKIKKIDRKIIVIKTEYSNKISSLQKCNVNTYVGFKKCFDEYKSDYVIFLEDDILPSYDFLEYHDHIISQFHNNKKFFAANSFSKDYKKKLNFTYSKFIYGVGKGWSIPKERWGTLKKMYKRLFLEKKEIFYDCYFEQKIKEKFFVVMPYRSRTFEQPSNGLNSKYNERNNIFNKDWRKSFLKKKRFEIKKYTFAPNMEYSWRKDCLHYHYTQANIFKNKISYVKNYIYKFLKIKFKQKKF
jgi:hypothetical protein